MLILKKYRTIDNSIIFSQELRNRLPIIDMMDIVKQMIQVLKLAFFKNISPNLKSIYRLNSILNNIYEQALKEIHIYIEQNLENTIQAVYIYSILSKINKIGDSGVNIAELILIYQEGISANTKIAKSTFVQ